MSYDVKVSTGDVHAKASQIQTEAAEIEARLAQLTSAMGELAGTWTGAASGSYQELFGTWGKTANMTKEALEAIGRSLNSAGSNYDQLESSLVSQFRT